MNFYIKKGKRYHPVSDEDVLAAGRALAVREVTGVYISKSSDAGQWVADSYMGLEREEFSCVYLSSTHEVIAMDMVAHGTIDRAVVHPRELVRGAIKHNAAAVILAHNHPSGSKKFSNADVALTTNLIKALALIDVRVLDHILVADGEPICMRDEDKSPWE